MSRTWWRLRPGVGRSQGAPERKDHAVKYIIMMFGGIGAATQDRSPEWIVGIVEAEEERALAIASQVVGYTEYPMEVRRIMDHSAQP
jgi:hypothetical protein